MSEQRINGAASPWQSRLAHLRAQRRYLWRRFALFLAVVGPGVITSNVDNDAGGITTYSVSGAQYGYALLWSLIPMTLALYVSEEMCARMGVITGKGLSDLIREEFGFRTTFYLMIVGFLVDLGNVTAEFAGVASAMEIFGRMLHMPPDTAKYIAVPVAALAVWLLVLRGTYRQVEAIFLIACTFYLSYFFSAILAHPQWSEAFKATVVPHFSFQPEYLLTLTALVGTTIAPWQFFYLQAGFVEKKVGPKQYAQARLDVLFGSISCMVIVFFIIVCCGATLFKAGHTHIENAGEAAQALAPLAGPWASALFAFGLLNASLFAASILPLSTAHVVCEGLGFEAGLDCKFREAPVFYWLYTALVVIGAAIILIPGAPLLKILILSQVGNGMWLPIVLIFMILLSNRADLMGDKKNGPVFNTIAWVSSIVMIALTLILIYAAITNPHSIGM